MWSYYIVKQNPGKEIIDNLEMLSKKIRSLIVTQQLVNV